MWLGEAPQIFIDLDSRYVLVSICLLVPLSECSTLKNVVILYVGLKNMRSELESLLHISAPRSPLLVMTYVADFVWSICVVVCLYLKSMGTYSELA